MDEREEIPKANPDELVDFGRHAGTRWTRVPVSYLTWMVGARHPQAARAQRELDRRGTTTPDLDVSRHAIDRASLRMLDKWRKTRLVNEGIATWLSRVARHALDHGRKVGGPNRYDYDGVRFVFEDAEKTEWPVLLTVINLHQGKPEPE